MHRHTSKHWVRLDQVEDFIHIEPALLIVGLALGSWILFKLFERRISTGRAKSLQGLFSNLAYHLILGCSLAALYWGLLRGAHINPRLERVTTYIGIFLVLSSATIFIKTCRIYVFEYFYISYRKVSFPVLIVNLVSLLLTLVISLWVCADLFNIEVTPILATSAIFSIVLGLALQDTLGNLFSGIALQIDKPYEIGDWIEVRGGGEARTGQVYEITWRATTLIAFTEEMITIPNKTMSSSQVSNFSNKFRPIYRRLYLTLPYKVDIPKTKELLLKAIESVTEVRNHPHPLILFHETKESGMTFKLVYSIDNYGRQFYIQDTVFSRCLQLLKNAGYDFAAHQVLITQDSSNLFSEETTLKLPKGSGHFPTSG